MRKSTKTELSKYLKQSTKAELEKEVKKLYDKFKEVKQYYEIEFTTDTTKIVETPKKKIYKEYFTSRGYPGKGRSNISRKVITDFKKISIFQKDVIELLLYRVEVMLDYAGYGDMGEAYYNSLARSFDEACRLMESEHLVADFKQDCERLREAAYNIGWGVSDAMDYSFEHYIGWE